MGIEQDLINVANSFRKEAESVLGKVGSLEKVQSRIQIIFDSPIIGKEYQDALSAGLEERYLAGLADGMDIARRVLDGENYFEVMGTVKRADQFQPHTDVYPRGSQRIAGDIKDLPTKPSDVDKTGGHEVR